MICTNNVIKHCFWKEWCIGHFYVLKTYDNNHIIMPIGTRERKNNNMIIISPPLLATFTLFGGSFLVVFPQTCDLCMNRGFVHESRICASVTHLCTSHAFTRK